jgi:hypothetical protein
MRAGVRGSLRVAAVLAIALGWGTGTVAQDRPIDILDTVPAPARIEGGIFFLVGGLVATMVRNRHTAPVQVTLRAWVFDQSGRLKGTNAVCTAELLDRGTRRAFNAPLEVRVTVAVERVVAERREWTLAEPAETAVGLARDAVRRGGQTLRLTEQRTEGLPEVACPCDCSSIAASCEAHCFDTGLRAFTCSPSGFDGCSASCSCK